MAATPNLARRIPYLDIMRVLACLLVLLVHAPEARFDEYGTTPSTAYAIYITIITVSSKLFFLLSGALLLPVKKPAREFIKRRLGVVLVPLIIWTVIYSIERYFNGSLSPKFIISVFYHPVEGALWFVYVMLVIYAMMPVMSKFIEATSKRTIEYVLAFWVASSFIPYAHGMFLSFGQASHNMLTAFANPFGYVLLGYYLHNYPLPIFTRRHWWKFALAWVFGVVLMPLFEFTVQEHFGVTYEEHLSTVTADISINDVMMATLLFSLAKRFAPASYVAETGESTKKTWRYRLAMLSTRMSICTFGIYLSHMLVLRTVIWPLTRPYLGHMHFLADGAICALLALITCYALSRLIYCLPHSRYIIGH